MNAQVDRMVADRPQRQQTDLDAHGVDLQAGKIAQDVPGFVGAIDSAAVAYGAPRSACKQPLVSAMPARNASAVA